ncbi:hypothetical protein SK128_022346 [Halocaridina rubra]|uniref:Uncharacterized protein n=1 Tax=Halocaridina rubra TaxID=373956 RepID=A0AAN8XHB3_HALRR
MVMMKFLTTKLLPLFLLAPYLGTGAMSTPSLIKVTPEGVPQYEAAGTNQHPQQETAASGDEKGFMEDIGFSHFFTDIGLQSSPSNLGFDVQQGFSVPHDFPSSIGSANLAPAAQLGAGHLGIGHGLGFSASVQQEKSTGEKVDPAIQGFIPADPLSFGGYSGASSSFVSSKATPNGVFGHAVNKKPIQTSPTRDSFSDSRYPHSSTTKYNRRPPKASAYDDQKYQDKKSQYDHSEATSQVNYNSPSPSKRPQGSVKDLEYNGNYNKPEPSYTPNSNGKPSDRIERKDNGSYESRNAYQESSIVPDYEKEFRAYMDDDEYRYAPTHQESRPTPQYKDDDTGYHRDQSKHHNTKYHNDDSKYNGGYKEPQHGSKYYDNHQDNYNKDTIYRDDHRKHQPEDPNHRDHHQKYHQRLPSSHNYAPRYRNRQPHYQRDHSGEGRYRSESRPQDHYQRDHTGEGRYRSESRPKGLYQRDHAGEGRYRSESRPQGDNQKDTKEHDKEPCKIVDKEGMTCKVCRDDEGGYSEHCAHSTRHGKDSVYANSRRGGSQKNGPKVGRENERSYSRPSPVYKPKPKYDNHHGQHSHHKSSSYQPHRAEEGYSGEHSAHQ